MCFLPYPDLTSKYSANTLGNLISFQLDYFDSETIDGPPDDQIAMTKHLTTGQIHGDALRNIDGQGQVYLHSDTFTMPTIDEAEKEMMNLISIQDMHEQEASGSLPAGDGHDSLADKDAAWKDFYWKPQPLEGFDHTSYILAVDALAEAAREKLRSKESIR